MSRVESPGERGRSIRQGRVRLKPTTTRVGVVDAPSPFHRVPLGRDPSPSSAIAASSLRAGVSREAAWTAGVTRSSSFAAFSLKKRYGTSQPNKRAARARRDESRARDDRAVQFLLVPRQVHDAVHLQLFKRHSSYLRLRRSTPRRGGVNPEVARPREAPP